MKLFSKRILKIRPGHLANFSGGAGYMPFIVIFSIPASLVSSLVSNLTIYYVAKKLFRGTGNDNIEFSPTGLSEFITHVKKHLVVLFIVSVILSVALFSLAWYLTYQFESYFLIAMFLLSVGPILAYVISTVLLIKLTCAKGLKKANLVWSYLTYLSLTVIFVFIGEKFFL
ncbi:MAG: hypothetical protein ACYC21_10610 [Eubacteriales bacterium]